MARADNPSENDPSWLFEASRAACRRAERLVAHSVSLLGRHDFAVRRSNVLRGATQLRRRPEQLIRRCAWCGDYGLGEAWVHPDELPDFLDLDLRLVKNHVTHSICPGCFEKAPKPLDPVPQGPDEGGRV